MDDGTGMAAGQDAGQAQAEVVAFLRGRSVGCPRCGYDLRDAKAAVCPECGEKLVLKIGSPRAMFGWLVLAMAPGCFSGVAAVFVLIPVGATLWQQRSSQTLPWPVLGADVFGFFSAAMVVVMYRHRQRIMAWTTRRQALFAIGIWGIHVMALGLFALAMWLWQ
ncbi:MAG: zinc ribbon domain-containing protein [Phycisphaeraceae bacterium]|nr:zinc ribbon domain-containing protein [Phycisphaeraceae bacterium]MCW5762875.1 zinc ribbon domain-containing protein [Phycisphaeraceae bacterium]